MATQQKEFEAAVRYHNGAAIIDLFGEINAFAEQGINDAYSEAESKEISTIILNFDEVVYINSTGIALIVGLLAKTRQNHKQLVTYGLSDHYLEIFHITRLTDFMTIAPDEATALAESA